ncbi:hypothetical protein [Enterococcus faecium]|uniref:Uncharacterized protein n=1 Tax=Enterococcus faecium TaxID=1352 RepID=A0A9X3XS82_ENTFC|nr:hypothetical protein [Enterococcus faecium]MDC4248061.1 hypothetical protein [Enterococcus faecium]
MNEFVKIQQEAQEKKKNRSAHAPAPQSINNIKKGNLDISLDKLKKKEAKKRYMFALYPSERELFNELALQAGFKNQYGEGNASAFLSAIIQELGGQK